MTLVLEFHWCPEVVLVYDGTLELVNLQNKHVTSRNMGPVLRDSFKV